MEVFGSPFALKDLLASLVNEEGLVVFSVISFAQSFTEVSDERAVAIPHFVSGSYDHFAIGIHIAFHVRLIRHSKG